MRALAALVALVCPALSLAQAWLPERGELNIGISYSDIYNKKHYLPNGDELDVGHTRTRTIGFTGVFGLTERLAVIASIPYVQAQYQGHFPHPVEVDDGHTHGTFTDFRIELHVQALVDPVAFAPYVATVIPTHDYEVVGHAAPGRGLNEYWVGFYLGKSLDPWIARTYVQTRYNYAFVEKVAGVEHDMSNVDLEIGYFITPDWSARVLGYWQETHGGIDVPIARSHPLFPHHDQLADDDHLNVGAGVSWAMAPRWYLNFLYLTSVRGQNGHKLDDGFIMGIAFSPRAY